MTKLSILQLKILSVEPLHGYAVSQRVRAVSKGRLLLEEGSLYPALYRMERKGWIRSAWAKSENRRRARVYSLSDKGLEEATAENIARGLSRREAKAEAAARLGDRRTIVCECMALASDDSPPNSLTTRRAKQLAVAAFALIAPPALLLFLLSHHLRQLPVEDPDTLAVTRHGLPDAFAVAKRTPEGVAAFRRTTARLKTPAGEVTVAGFSVSSRFFLLQGVEPVLGSLAPLGGPSIVLSHRLWKSRFGSDSGVIGLTLEVNGALWPVRAVMPPDYWFLERSRLFWLAADGAPSGRNQGLLLVRLLVGAEPDTELPKLIPLREASQGAIAAASAILQAALCLLAMLGLAQTVSLARALGGWRSSATLLALNYLFLFGKALPALTVAAILWTVLLESPALIPGGYFLGVWSLVSVYLLALLLTAIVWCAVVDQRARCPVCQRVLGMPLPLGVTGSILFDLPAVEYMCAYGHGTLYLPEPTSEGVRESAWRRRADWWDDLLAASVPSGAARS
jgi:DNA-binding PadR family transcriptional regulator